jgi:hypothetical protein
MTPIRADLHRLMPRLAGRARPTAVAAAVATALGVFLAPQAMSQTASSADLQDLKNQVEQLQRKLERLQTQQGQQAATVPAPAAKPAPAAAGNAPSFYAGPVKVTLGGFVELMAIDRNRNESADWASNYNTSIPYPNSHNHDLSEFHFTARQSRLQALAEGPANDRWATEAYVESDFGGAGGTANYNESSSFSPRMRHYYADLQDKTNGWYLMFGQNWSLVTANKSGISPRQENVPPVIDGQYVPGFSWLRVAQIRFVKKFGEVVNVGISLENPAALVTSNATAGAPALASMFNNPGASNSFTAGNNTTATNISTDYLPDVIAKIAFDPGWGHYEVFGLNRWFRARNITPGQQSNVKTTGTGFGGNMLLPLVPKVLDFQAAILAGKGVGRYGSAQLPDTTVNPGTLGLEPLRGYQALVGLTVHPTPDLTLYAFAGKEQVDAQAYTVVAAGKTYGYGYGNGLFDNTGCQTEGVGSCAANTSSITSGALGGWWKFYTGTLGNAQFGLTDTYIKRQIFAGVGGDPATNINILMASFRFYPYQK